jgi:hypothetical protein
VTNRLKIKCPEWLNDRTLKLFLKRRQKTISDSFLPESPATQSKFFGIFVPEN